MVSFSPRPADGTVGAPSNRLMAASANPQDDAERSLIVLKKIRLNRRLWLSEALIFIDNDENVLAKGEVPLHR
jgi:hypothetical protein